MYVVGEEEIEAIAKVIRSGKLFRYGATASARRFEERYADYLGVKHFALAASGSNALTAAMTAVGLGPGDEVLIPAHTYMATATSVLAVGAIPVIVDIDETHHHRPEGGRGGDRAAHQGGGPGPYVGRGLRHGRDHGDRARHDLIVIEDAARASAAATRAASSARSAISAPSASTTTRT